MRTISQITARPLPAPLREQAVADAVRSSRPAWVSCLERGSRDDISAGTPSITVPTLVIAGTADPTLTPALLEREVVQRIATAQVAVMPNAGHLLPLEAPAATAESICGHCREHCRAV